MTYLPWVRISLDCYLTASWSQCTPGRLRHWEFCCASYCSSGCVGGDRDRRQALAMSSCCTCDTAPDQSTLETIILVSTCLDHSEPIPRPTATPLVAESRSSLWLAIGNVNVDVIGSFETAMRLTPQMRCDAMRCRVCASVAESFSRDSLRKPFRPRHTTSIEKPRAMPLPVT